MSGTRHAKAGGPVRQEMYMSAPEFAELRGISAVATAARTALLERDEDRELIWWVQAQSLRPGALKQLIADLVDQFPERLGTPSMHGKYRGQKIFSGNDLEKIEAELNPNTSNQRRLQRQARLALRLRQLSESLLVEGAPEEPEGKTSARASLVDRCRQAALDGLENFLLEFCINPECSPEQSSVPYFADIVGALRHCKQQSEEILRDNFVLTEIGGQVWSTLVYALERRGMVLIEGLEGRGKSAAAKTWCEIHSGRARFVSLKGIAGKTNVFRAIAKALGVASGYGYKANELQNRIEDVLCRSGLMLVTDEAHFMFDQRPRMYSRPELIDWVDTALVNERVPVALISTPQFLQCAQQAGEQVNWNWRQFKRRVKRLIVLPDANTDSDLAAVAKQLLPGVGAAGIKLAVNYAKVRKLDISGLADIAEEARLIASKRSSETITFDDLDRAFRENILPSDAAFARRLSVRKTASRKMDVEPDEASEAESLTEVPSRISDRQIPTTPALPPEPAALLPA